MKKFCDEYNKNVDAMLYSDKVTPSIYVCEECGQFINDRIDLKLPELISAGIRKV